MDESAADSLEMNKVSKSMDTSHNEEMEKLASDMIAYFKEKNNPIVALWTLHGFLTTSCWADSASLVQCFSTLCRLYLIKIVFRIFLGRYFVVVKFIILMEWVT